MLLVAEGDGARGGGRGGAVGPFSTYWVIRARGLGVRRPTSPTRTAMSTSASATHCARKNSSSGSLIWEPMVTMPAMS